MALISLGPTYSLTRPLLIVFYVWLGRGQPLDASLSEIEYTTIITLLATSAPLV